VSEGIIKFSDFYFRNKYYERQFNEIEKLGEGGFGQVFKVSNKYHPEELLAVKKIPLEEEFKKQILREIQIFPIVQSLQRNYAVFHFNVWIEKSIDKNKCTLFIEMDLCDKTLKEIIEEIRSDSILKDDNILTPIGYYIASQLFIEILESVQHLHKNNIIHRDLNPSNIMLKIPENFESFIKIVDFGLIAIHESADQTHSSDKGNYDYIAPEVFDGRKYDTKADIYSLGKISSELFDFEINE
jgi:serine/threonine protein kinase